MPTGGSVEKALEGFHVLKARLHDAGWAAVSVTGGEAETLKALKALGDQLGVVVHGRNGSLIEAISPTPRGQARSRSLSAEHGLGPLPLHVELSHRLRPCRYVLFGCLSPGSLAVETQIVDRRRILLSTEERTLLRDAVVLIRSGRRSFYASIMPEGEPFLRFDRACMQAIDDRGRAAMAIVEDRLGGAVPVLYRWRAGDILLLDNWAVLHGRASAEGALGRRISRILIDAR